MASSLKYPFLRKLEMADMEILKINAGYVLKKKSRKRTRLPAEVIALLTADAQAKHLAETDDPMDIDEDPAQPAGLNPNDVDAADDGLDDLIFVFDNGEVHQVQDEPMDVGLNDLVVDVNEAGDYNVQRQP